MLYSGSTVIAAPGARHHGHRSRIRRTPPRGCPRRRPDRRRRDGPAPLLPIWEKKEPSIVLFLKARVALPLFFERALIELTPRRVLYWSDGNAASVPAVTVVSEEAA